MSKTTEQMRAEMDAKYPAVKTAKKLAAVVAEVAENGGDVSMFPKAMRRTLTQEIADYLGVTEEVGSLVRNEIDEQGLLDWSECTTKEMHRACREAYAELTA